MKNLLFSLILLFAFVGVNAQSTSPRFGTTKNSDNTGRVLTYKVATVTDAAGADSVVIAPNAFETIYKVAALDSLTFKSPTVVNSYYGDQITLQVTGTSGDLIKFTGTNWVSAGTATLSSGLNAIITFIFNGAKWVEQSRVVL
jgi:hypothetical protein